MNVTTTAGHVIVTDPRLGNTLTWTWEEWLREVVDEIQAGGWLPCLTYRNFRGEVVLRQQIGGTELYFTEPEWDAFIDAVRRGEYDQQEAA